MPDLIQTIRITLSNGRVGLFSGRALITSDQTPVRVVGINFHAPRPLAPGCEFVSIEDITRQSNEFDTKTKAQAGVRPPMAKGRRSGGKKKPHHEGGGRKGKALQKA